MDFFSHKRKVILAVVFCLFLVIQQLALQYGRSYRKQNVGIDKNGGDELAIYEVNRLQQVWRQADVDKILLPTTLADYSELLQARKRLKTAEMEIQNFEKLTQVTRAARREFFDKMHAYYNHSTEALLSIIDFLLSKQGQYSVKGNEINFANELDGDKFLTLIRQLDFLYKEKNEIDTYILKHNQEVQKTYLRAE